MLDRKGFIKFGFLNNSVQFVSVNELTLQSMKRL